MSEVAVAMFLGSFGVKTTLIYIISGTVLSMIAGYILNRMHLERYLTSWIQTVQTQSSMQSEQWKAAQTPFLHRLPIIMRE